MKWIAAAAIFTLSSICSAIEPTNVQISAGALLYGTDVKSVNTQVETTGSARLLISGQVLDDADLLWFELFHHQGAQSTFKNKDDRTIENEIIAGFTGAGFKLTTSESRPLAAHARAGGMHTQYINTQTNSAFDTKETEKNYYWGYFVGSGLSFKIANDQRIVAEYTGYKVGPIYKFQHSFQVGLAIYF